MRASLYLLLWLVAVSPVSAGEPPTVDLCELLKRPPEYRGRVVRVTARYIFNFEVSGLWQECGLHGSEGLMCLAAPGDHPEIVATADVSFDEYVKRVAAIGPKETIEGIQWTPYVEEPVVAVRDKLWRKMSRLPEKDSNRKLITIIGRFEYGPSMVRYRDGGFSFVQGYGHLNGCRSRIVMGRVVSIENR